MLRKVCHCGRLCEQRKGLNNVCLPRPVCFTLSANRDQSVAVAPKCLPLTDATIRGAKCQAVLTYECCLHPTHSCSSFLLGACLLKNKPFSLFCLWLLVSCCSSVMKGPSEKVLLFLLTAWKHPIVWLNQSLLSLHSPMGIWVISGLGYSK